MLLADAILLAIVSACMMRVKHLIIVLAVQSIYFAYRWMLMLKIKKYIIETETKHEVLVLDSFKEDGDSGITLNCYRQDNIDSVIETTVNEKDFKNLKQFGIIKTCAGDLQDAITTVDNKIETFHHDVLKWAGSKVYSKLNFVVDLIFFCTAWLPLEFPVL